jgi:proline iminopeptidase
MLHAAVSPFRPHALPVDALHTLHIEESGRPDGVPVVYLHGGPGAGLEPSMRRVHDPAHYRLVMFDQRGAGHSTPAGELRDNTTRHLIDDIECVRRHLGIDRWIVSGGSWGSTLALAYAQAHPSRCRALVLRGVWLATEAEIDWFLRGLPMFFPDVWQQMVDDFCGVDLADDFKACHAAIDRLILDPDPAVAAPAAIAKARIEFLASTVAPDRAAIDLDLTPAYAVPYQRVCVNYMHHACFLERDQLIRGMGAVAEIPGFIVQGRLDLVCPPEAAHRVVSAWPGAQLLFVEGAGHSCTEPGIALALLQIMERLKGEPN